MNPTHKSTTRASLIGTAAKNASWFASFIAGTAALSSPIYAAEWDGETSSDWNVLTNWDGDIGTGGTNAIINTKEPNIATISADLVATPVDIIVGTGAGSDGQVNHIAGTASTGGGNWLYVGTDGGTGVYNLADTGATGGGITGFGQGSGTVNAGNQIHIGSFNAGGSNGTLNIHTTGAVNAPGEFTAGRGTDSVGVVNLESGTLATGGFTRFGFNFDSEGAGSGELNMTGGTIDKTGDNHFVIGDGPDAVGVANVSGGEINVNNEIWVGQNGADGTLDFSGGTITNATWVAIGRAGGTGHVEMTGGTWNKTNDGSNFIVGASGPGTMNQSSGLVDVQAGITWIGELDGSNGTLTLTGDAEFRTSTFSLGVNGGATGTLNLDGGTAVTSQFVGGDGATTVNFNGTQIIASADSADFIANLDNAVIGGGNLLVDSAGFDLTASQGLSGSGEVLKTGSGNLALAGANTYAGATTVNGGGLLLSTASTVTGDVTVADDAGFGVIQTEADGTLELGNLTMGESSLEFDFGDIEGVTSNPLLDVTGTLTLNGSVTVNITDQAPEVAAGVPMFSYSTKAGSGDIGLGTLPRGVMATLTDDGAGQVTLDVDRYAVLVWDGIEGNQWTGANWANSVDDNATISYVDGDPVVFSDFGLAEDVVLDATVSPADLRFENSAAIAYNFTGTGEISGDTGLLKTGEGSVTMGIEVNDFTGTTRLEGGTLSASALADLGSPSSIGAGDLVLAGGTLDYTGGPVSINRGFTLDPAVADVGSGISLASDVTMSGPVTANLGKLQLSGPGILSLTHPGPISLTNGPGDGDPATFRLNGGGLTLATDNPVDIVGNTQIAVTDGSSPELRVSGDTAVTLNRLQIGLGVGSTPSVVIEDSGSISKVGGSWLSIGNSNDTEATMTVRDNGVFNAGGGDFNVSDVDTSKGTLNIQGNGSVSADGTMFIGKNTGTEGTLNMDGGTLTAANWISIGRRTDAIGEVNMNGGTINQTGENEGIIVGENGIGTLNVNAGAVNIAGGGLFLTAETVGTGDATVNLNGGTITARRVAERDFAEGNLSTFNFNGGLLVVGENPDPDYMSNLDDAFVEAGGANIDTNGQDIAIAQPLLEGTTAGGGLTKSGEGFLQLNGANTFTGTTTATAGLLGGTGSVAGPLVVDAGAVVAPGAGVGTFTAEGATISGTYLCEIDGTESDQLVANGALDISNATLDVSTLSAPASGVYIIATYDSLNGTFAETLNLPGDFTIDYNFEGGNQIALTGTPVASAFDTWAAGFGLDPETDGAPDADADGSGQSNLVEFALGGNPIDGGDNAKIHSLTGDSDADTDDELLMTIAVREGTPAFAGSPSPTAATEGITYTIEGSLDLSEFPEAVSLVTPAMTSDLPAAPEGYEYRTFRLDASNGLPSQGFLRVNVGEATAE